jgi:uncharacterized membrane protein YhfC
MALSFISHFLNGLLMVLIPVGLGIFLTRRFGMGWRLWWIGAATFVASQIGHIPFNIFLTQLFTRGVLPAPPAQWQPLFNAVVLGLSAGLWEECARYVTYRWWAKDARSWRAGLMLGAGHGGIEAIILGFLVLLTFVVMSLAFTIDISAYISAEQMPLLQQQLSDYWSSPWYANLLGALERVFAIIFHLAASLIVLQVFLLRQVRWLLLAIIWHAWLDAAAIYAAIIWGAYAAEGLLALFAVVNLVIIYSLYKPEPEPAIEEEPVPVEISPPELSEVPETSENLESTRFGERID